MDPQESDKWSDLRVLVPHPIKPAKLAEGRKAMNHHFRVPFEQESRPTGYTLLLIEGTRERPP